MAPYAGYPAAADALGRLGEVATELGIEVRPGDADRSAIPSVATIGSGDPWMASFAADRTARAWPEERLSRRERTIVVLTTDVSQQTLGESFRLHVRLALEAGASTDAVRDAVRFCGELSLAKATAALAHLDTTISRSTP